MQPTYDADGFTAAGEETQEFTEIFNDLEYGHEEIKPFKLDALFKEIEQISAGLAPLQPDPVSLTA
jgi:hypothetical protein